MNAMFIREARCKFKRKYLTEKSNLILGVHTINETLSKLKHSQTLF